MGNFSKVPGFQTRSASWSDVQAIVDLRNTSSQNNRGGDCTAVHWQKRHWYDTNIDLDKESLLILDDHKAIAYAELASEAPFIVYEMNGVVHPDYRGLGLGTQLVRWSEDRTRAIKKDAPENAAIFIQNSVFDSNQPGRDLLVANDFVNVREFVNLKIDMIQKPPEPVWPEGISVRRLQSPDWEKVGPALQDAFKDHWGIVEYTDDKLVKDGKADEPDPRETDPEAFDSAYFNSPGLCFVAWDGDQVAGSCLCNARTIEFPEAGYIGSLSVPRPWRQRGIGRALTLHALNTFYALGTTQVLTDTDGDSLTKAYCVYQNAGMNIFRKEIVYEKKIRPGKDYVKR